MTEEIQRWLFDPLVGKLVAAVLAIAVTWAISRAVQGAVVRRVAGSTARYRVRKMIGAISYVVMLVLLASIFSDKLGGLTITLGVAGAGIAFALQEVIASVAGWAAISFGRFYDVGDRVQVGGIKGDVIDIGILRTTLMEIGEWVNGDLYNGRIVRVANSYVFKDPVFNYSGDLPFLWDEITVPVRYGSDWQLTRGMITGVLQEVCGETAPRFRSAWDGAVRKYALEDARIDPMVTIVANDNWIQFTGRYIVDYRSRRTVKDRIFTRLLEEVDKSGGRIRLASATFEITDLPSINVQLDGKGATAISP
ncbi:MAG: mechanosensitive ion channel family protein [Gammaproteobacteria bacterium]